MKFGNRADTPGTLDDPDDIALQAAAWADALNDGPHDAALTRTFAQWRDAHPAHAAAFEKVDAAYRIAQSVHGSRAMIDFENEVLALGTLRTRRRWRRRALGWGMAASVVAVITAGLVVTGGSWSELQYLQARARHALAGETLYRAAVGERYAVTLDDGTALTLNTDSRAAVRFDGHTRQVRLLQGQALFEVAKDAHRPFVVTAGQRTVTALGTAFDVRYSAHRFEVTLIEGKVEVAERVPDAPRAAAAAAEGAAAAAVAVPHPSPLTPHVLTPGQQLIAAADIASAQRQPLVRQADLKRTTSWRYGQVIFEDDLLGVAIQEMNRYAKRRIAIADPALAQLRLSGAFETGQTGTFIEALTTYFPISVARQNSEEIVLAWQR